MKTITGTVAYRERIALPPHAVVTVALEDVSLADAPAKVLAKQTFETEGKQVPLAFELSYNSNDIKPNHRYSLRARIEVDGSCALLMILAFQLSRMQNKRTKRTFALLVRVNRYLQTKRIKKWQLKAAIYIF